MDSRLCSYHTAMGAVLRDGSLSVYVNISPQAKQNADLLPLWPICKEGHSASLPLQLLRGVCPYFSLCWLLLWLAVCSFRTAVGSSWTISLWYTNSPRRARTLPGCYVLHTLPVLPLQSHLRSYDPPSPSSSMLIRPSNLPTDQDTTGPNVARSTEQPTHQQAGVRKPTNLAQRAPTPPTLRQCLSDTRRPQARQGVKGIG